MMRIPCSFLSLVLVLGCATDDGGAGTPYALSGFDSIPPAESTLGSEDAFGSVDGAARLDDGRLVVADGMNGRLSLYSGEELVSRYGRLGPGPGEFRGLGTVVRFGGDTVIVLDPRRFDLVVLRIAGDSLERLHDLDLPVGVTDLCASGRRLFVLGQHENHLLHEVTLDGGIVRSFGASRGSSPMEIALHATGKLACSEDPGVVALAERSFGILRVFSMEGEPVAEDSIPRFSRTVYEFGPGTVRPRRPEAGYTHSVAGVHWVGDHLLLNLLRSASATDRVPEARVWSPEDGWGEDPAPWPRILAHTPDGLVYAAVEDPYPVVRIYRVR